jgi:hypothetical protein
MKRAFGRYLLWGYLVGTPGFLALFVPLAWHSGTALLILGGGIAALAAATAAMVPLWKTIGRHRAVLAAYGIETSIYGQVLPTPEEAASRRARAAQGLDLRTEARRALRVYRRVVGFSVALVAGFWGVTVPALLPAERNSSALAWGLPSAMVAGLVLALVVSSALGRVEKASEGAFTRGSSKRRSPGAVFLILAMSAGPIAASLAQDAIGGPSSLTAADQVRSWIFLLMAVVAGVVWVRAARVLVRRLRELAAAEVSP